MSYREVYEKWCNDPYFDEASREELKALEGNEAEIEDRFYRQLEFGTGGLRGVIGAGTNRMNIYTVRQATQGLANYIISQNGQEKGVAIAHDSRRMSPEFAREAALCLNANGLKTYLFESLRPTPELSFAVREFGCISGIVITASHNLEHLGRGTTEGMDMFIVVIEPGARSIQTYKNVKRLAEELGVHQVHVVANKVRDEKDEAFIQDRIPPEDLLGMVHYNPEIMEADREGSSPYDYSAAAVEEIRKIKTKIDKSNMPGMEKV